MSIEVAGEGYVLTMDYQPPLLHARVVGGEDTRLPVTFGYWMRIAEELRATGATQLLVVDDMRGEVMTDDELARFFEGIRGQGLEQARVAYVEGRADQIPRIEFVELMALERGYQVRMFGNETDALVWLRHGET